MLTKLPPDLPPRDPAPQADRLDRSVEVSQAPELRQALLQVDRKVGFGDSVQEVAIEAVPRPHARVTRVAVGIHPAEDAFVAGGNDSGVCKHRGTGGGGGSELRCDSSSVWQPKTTALTGDAQEEVHFDGDELPSTLAIYQLHANSRPGRLSGHKNANTTNPSTVVNTSSQAHRRITSSKTLRQDEQGIKVSVVPGFARGAGALRCLHESGTHGVENIVSHNRRPPTEERSHRPTRAYLPP